MWLTVDRWAYSVDVTQPNWAARQVRLIADEVKRHRMARDMSAADLAAKTVELGHPITRSALANLESGRRGIVTTADLLVLAAALGVPPVELLFPVGHAETVEVLPGDEQPIWDAVEWFDGEVLPVQGRVSPVWLFRQHALAVRKWERAGHYLFAFRNQLANGNYESAELADLHRARVDALVEEMRRHEGRVAEIRASLQYRSLLLPPLPSGFPIVDLPDGPFPGAVNLSEF
jgi:transcriptional regulator with XRE-family HTH domain